MLFEVKKHYNNFKIAFLAQLLLGGAVQVQNLALYFSISSNFIFFSKLLTIQMLVYFLFLISCGFLLYERSNKPGIFHVSKIKRNNIEFAEFYS